MAKDSIQQFKRCAKCREVKPFDAYYKQKGTARGIRSRCIECTKQDHLLSIEYHKQRTARYRRENAEKEKARHAKYNAENPEKARLSASRWRENNPEKARDIMRRHDLKTRRTPRGKLDNAMSSAVHRWLAQGSKAGRKWEELVGYTADALMLHLERLFADGMTWENYGPVWHVDHVVPMSAFNYETPDHIDFKRCWALSNLRPLWAFDNMSKKNKIERPFQPSLAF